MSPSRALGGLLLVGAGLAAGLAIGLAAEIRPAHARAAPAPPAAPPMGPPTVLLADPDRTLPPVDVDRLAALVERARGLAAGGGRHVRFRLILGQRDYRRLLLDYAPAGAGAPPAGSVAAYVLDSAGYLVEGRSGPFAGDAEALVRLADGVR